MFYHKSVGDMIQYEVEDKERNNRKWLDGWEVFAPRAQYSLSSSLNFVLFQTCSEKKYIYIFQYVMFIKN